VETGKPITEKEFVSFISQIVGALKKTSSEEKINKAGLSNIISFFIDLFSAGIEANNSLAVIGAGLAFDIDFSWPMFINNHTNESPGNFEASNMDSWKYAVENTLVWQGKLFQIDPDKIFTETLFVKLFYTLFSSSLKMFYSQTDLRNIYISTILDGLKRKMDISEASEQANDQIHKMIKSVPIVTNSEKQGEGIQSQTPIRKKENFSYQINSATKEKNKNFRFATIIVIIGVIILTKASYGLYIALTSLSTSALSSWDSNVVLGMLGIVIASLSLIFVARYNTAKNELFYYTVCANMSNWLGHSSNDLIIQWGAPTKTSRFPSDKTMTILEYKDSIRNYTGMRYKGIYSGQSKTTRYIKSFFVRDGIIIDFKYDIV
jgi:hypothetical protein